MKNIYKPLLVIALALLATVSLAQMETRNFTVTIENVSAADSLLTSNGYVPTPLAPGFWVVHEDANELFTAGKADYGDGLEALAEDGNPAKLLEHYSMSSMVGHYGVFDTPDGAMEAGPLLPGASYSFSFDAQAGDRLSFATMFVQSNDLFYGTTASGIALFDAMGQPISGDLSNQVILWDAGTEVDEEAGQGMHQPLKQMSANSGDDENGAVRVTEQMLSLNGQVVKLTITVK